MYMLSDGTEYPEYLIPKSTFVAQMSIDDLLKAVPELEVIRRSDKPQKETFNELGLLRQDAITGKELPNLSLHMLGGGLKVEDIRFVQKKPSSDTWPSTPPIDPLTLLQYVEIAPVYTPVFFTVKDIHEVTFPYVRSGSDKMAKKLREQFPKKSLFDEVADTITFSGTSKVAHAPAQLNYWHAELRFLDVEGNSIKNTSSKWRKNAMTSALSHFITNAGRMEALDEDVVIPEEVYIA